MASKFAGSRLGEGWSRRRSVAAAAASFAGLTLWASVAAAQASSECYFDNARMVDALPLAGQKQSTDEVTGNLHYLLHLPEGHDPLKKWPVVVFMHGSGEINATGSMLNQLTKHSLPRVAEDPMFKYPFIVISPQIDNAGWVSHAAEVGAALDRVETEFGGDPNREYLTGLSYGGVGTFAVGIALSDRIAALMPVTPGGSVANWDMRSKIVDLPIWLFNGTIDAEYGTNTQRVADLEASGGEAFFTYDYAFADEYKDIAPQQALTHKHVFGSYENIGHDVWHAAYGVYCPTLDSQKTVQYDWLLSQSKDGSPWHDPRDPNPGVGGSGGMPAGGGGSAGASSVPGGGSSAGGAPSVPMAGAGGPSAAGGATTAAGNSNGFVPMSGGDAEDSGSCSVAATVPRGSGVWALFAAGLGLTLRSRRRQR